MGIGTLRVFNHDTLAPGAVWPMHPHRDVEGITYVVAGHFEHADSIGGGGVLEAGGVQRMTLGSGAQHSERNHSQTEEMQFLQLWILPERRGLKPEVAQRQHTTEDRHNRYLRIIRPMGTEVRRERPSGREHPHRSIGPRRYGGAPHRARPPLVYSGEPPPQ